MLKLKLILFLCILCTLTGCFSAKNIEYIPVYKYLDSCEPVPPRPKLLGVSTDKRVSTADNLYRIDKDLDMVTSHALILENIIRCFERQLDPSSLEVPE